MSTMPPLAASPAIEFIENDFIDEMLAGPRRTNIIVASVAAGVYFLFLLLSLFNLVRDSLGVHALLMMFCAFRVVCFSVRAYMQDHLTETLAIVYEVFFAIGFVAIVKLLVSLLYAWTLPVGIPPKRAFGLGLLRNHGTIQERFITILLFVGAVCTIIGSTDAYRIDTTIAEYNKGLTLMKAGYTIYLVAIGLYDIAVVTGPLLNRFSFGRPRSVRSATMIALALEVCGLLLTCKAVFQVYAIYVDPSLTFNNKFFWPLEVVPELLVLCIVCTPGFIRYVYRGSHAHPETDGPKVTGTSPLATPRADGIAPTTTTPTGATAVATTEAV